MEFEFQDFLKDLEKQAENNDIGKMLASGIGVGLSENSYMAITAVENVYVKLETLTKNAAKNAENLRKKQQERALQNLKNSLELEFLSEQEYYEKLKKYRDEHLQEGTERWYECTEEIIKYNKRLAEETRNEQLALLESQYEKAREAAEHQLRLMESVKKLQEELEENLKSEDGPWYSTLKVVLRGANNNGTDQVYQKNTLESFEEDIRRLEDYREKILQLKELGNIPDGVFSDIASMEVEEAINAADVILSADEETRKKFVEGFNRRNSLAESIAEELNEVLNGEELKELGIDSLDAFVEGFVSPEDVDQYFLKLLEDGFENIPESYYELGMTSGESFASGFEECFLKMVDETKVSMYASVDEFAEEASRKVAEVELLAVGGSSNTYNTSYTFNASKDTTTMQLQAAKNAATLEKLRGGC